MKIYLVGGAVRDKLLGRKSKDHDWVVTESSPEAMIKLGYQPVGKDFPVFLHPDSKEEYALARTERKTSQGYHGFSFNTSTEVTLKDDLARRDLTINALAEDENGQVIDYYNGLQDLKDRVLRHVSPAFTEDPVRVLRVARFAARYAPLGFSIATETMQLMQAMVENREVDSLVAERVWQETRNALTEQRADVFFTTLRECGALKVLFPEIERLFGVPQPAQYHPEVDCGIHTMMVLQQSIALSDDNSIRFAALTHDLGKGTTDPDTLPHHYGHERRSFHLVNDLCQRYKIPNHYCQLARITAEHHTMIHRAFDLTAKKVLKVLNACDVMRKPERFSQMLTVCEADSKGRTGYENNAYPQREFYEQAAELYRGVNVQEIIQEGHNGAAIKEQLYRKRLNALKAHCAITQGKDWS